MPRRRIVPFKSLVTCDVCGDQHVILGSATLLRQPISFGGGADQPKAAPSAAPWTLSVECPREGKPFEASVLVGIEYDETISGVTVEKVVSGLKGSVGHVKAATTDSSGSGPATTNWIDEEIGEWRKNTISTQRAYATTMLTTSSGSVAIYFAVLKYLGWERANLSTPIAALTVVPPILFMLAVVAYALALRPALQYVSREDYGEFRAARIQHVHHRVKAGTTLYLLALGGSITAFLTVLWEAS